MSVHNFDKSTNTSETEQNTLAPSLKSRDSEETLYENAPENPETTLKERSRRSDIHNPKALKYLTKYPEWIDRPFCHERVLTRVDSKSNVGAAVASTAISAISILASAGSQWGGVRDFSHYCSRCEEMVAVKYHSKGEADVMSPR